MSVFRDLVQNAYIRIRFLFLVTRTGDRHAKPDGFAANCIKTDAAVYTAAIRGLRFRARIGRNKKPLRWSGFCFW